MVFSGPGVVPDSPAMSSSAGKVDPGLVGIMKRCPGLVGFKKRWLGPGIIVEPFCRTGFEVPGLPVGTSRLIPVAPNTLRVASSPGAVVSEPKKRERKMC